jgi:putative transcriptional regulator
MEDEMFNELLQSVHKAGAIMRGELPPGRVTRIEPEDMKVKEIRNRLKLSQSQFARLLGISVRTLQNWEQGKRVPVGPSRRLLQIADKHPSVFLDTIHP